MGKNMNSPAVLPSHQQNDVEAGTYKDAPIQRINRWRQARNALCACQFWHILYLKKKGGQASNTVHAHAAAEHALATETGEEVTVNIRTSTNGEDDDVVKRKSFFGANTYPAEKSKRFLACLLEACHQDIYLIIVAVASSVMGLVTKGTRFGYWEEGGNVAAVVMVNIIVKAICKYRQSQIHNVKEKGRNMYLKVCMFQYRNKTTLEEFLNWVATSTGKVGLAVAFAAMSVLFLRWFTGDKLDGNPKFTGVKTKLGDIIEEVNKIINVSFTIAVVAVPQGLPLAVTLNILSATKRMVVRRPFACETLAFVKNFLCDKTLLTLNEMSVVEAYAGGKKIDLSDDNMPYVSLNLSSLLTEGIAWNTEGDVHATKSGVDDSGSPTDKAILRWGIDKLGMKVEEKSQSPVLKVVPFDSEKKRRAVALQLVN